MNSTHLWPKGKITELSRQTQKWHLLMSNTYLCITRTPRSRVIHRNFLSLVKAVHPDPQATILWTQTW